MSSNSQTLRYSARNSTIVFDCDAVEKDIINNKDSLNLSLNVIDEPLRALPETIEVLIRERRPEDLKKLLSLASTITSDSEGFHRDKDVLETRLSDLLAKRPKKKSKYSDHYAECVQLGSDFIDLNQRIIGTAGETVNQFADILQGPAVEPETAKLPEAAL